MGKMAAFDAIQIIVIEHKRFHVSGETCDCMDKIEWIMEEFE